MDHIYVSSFRNHAARAGGYEAQWEPSNDVFTSTYHKVAYVCGNKSGRRSLSMVCLVSIKNISPTISPSLDVQTQVTNDTRHD